MGKIDKTYGWKNRVKRNRMRGPHGEVSAGDLVIMDEKVFNFAGANLTVILDSGGNPWWIGNEVCEVLGIANPRDAVSNLDDDEKDAVGITDTIGRVQNGSIINESGLYSLIFKSRKPHAKTFKKWVTSEVLPQIRKTGGYRKPVELTRMELIELAMDAEKERMQMAQLADAERERADKAVREKSYISNKREAQAMQRASVEVRRSNKLLDELGMGPKWKSVRATHWIFQYFKHDLATLSQVGKTLVRISKQMGKEVRETNDPLFNYVNTYHITVLNKFRRLLDDDPEFMKEYRLDTEETD